YLRLLYARAGTPHCPVCGREISSQSVDQISDMIMEYPEGTRVMIMAPVIRQQKGEHKKVIERILRDGFIRLRVDGEMVNISEEDIKLEKTRKHTIEIVVDRIVVRPGVEGRLAEAVELGVQQGDGLLVASLKRPEDEDYSDRLFSTQFACPDHGVSIGEMEPRTFSFNNPYGACPECNGLGFIQHIDPALIIDSPEKSLENGAFNSSFGMFDEMSYYSRSTKALADKLGVDLTKPYEELPEEFRKELMYGTQGTQIDYHYINSSGREIHRKAKFEGIATNLERRYQQTDSAFIREKIEKYMSLKSCLSCKGERMRPEVLAVTVGGLNIMEFCHLTVRDALQFIRDLKLTERQAMIARLILKEITARLSFLSDVGLEYLTLSRSAGTLSGGESQRIRLATQIGSGLVGVLYILDEPSIGLHQRDNDRLLATLRHLTDIGNTLIIVEHDEDTMYAADHIVDIGPGAGIHGGSIVAQGTVEEIMACPDSITGQYLSGAKKIPVPASRRKGNGQYLKVKGAAENNLKTIDVDFPLGEFICVTGVSGSGKSSLVNEVLAKGVSASLYRTKEKAGKHGSISGLGNIDKVINIDQSPIGRTPRSNPATYTGVFTQIRDLFAQTQDAKMRGFAKGRFSFNVRGGRCESCRGDGIIKIEMNFLPDVYVPCEVCHGKRYNRETLEVRYKGKNISDVLDMNIEEALSFFENNPSISRKLQTLYDVGLGYVKLGQPSTQLSGGEAQRIKLAAELSRKMTGRTLYILDEPTTGLHFADVDRLLDVLQRLVDAGNTVLVIEHNLDVIKCADHIIDLGPEGGDRGGRIVAAGTPEEIAACVDSYTGRYLKKILERG
ncbi:MAG: excinuclease ABC subunit UvrA, partial [Firmicutes bacterium]|nr:excinuclease ABC subunit UvrA [Bacillota bacterium]